MIYFEQIFNIENNFIKEIKKYNKIFIILDSNIFKIYSDKLNALLRNNNIDYKFIKFNAGEKYKNRKTRDYIEDKLFEYNCQKDSCIVAIGGGVTTDLAGFVAATYFRGIDAIFIPTSLMAMVDASIGGKNGINTEYGKNTLGTIREPNSIFIDINFLETLPEDEYILAFAEIIKHAVVLDRDYFFELKNPRTFGAAPFTKGGYNLPFCKGEMSLQSDRGVLLPFCKGEMSAQPTEGFYSPFVKGRRRRSRQRGFSSSELKKIIKTSVELKTKIIKQDKYEKNLREILNFGHTIGHAIEKISDYKIPHGAAVTAGIIAESYISYKLGILSESDFREIVRKNPHGFAAAPFNKGARISPFVKRGIFSALFSDKKSRNNTPRFVLIKSIGEVYCKDNQYAHEVPEEIIIDAINYLDTYDSSCN